MSLTIEELAKYPFLPQARKYITRLDINFSELASYPEVRKKAKQKILSSFKEGENVSLQLSKQYETEIISYGLALLYLSGIAENKLIQRFALFESQKINRHLTNEKHLSIIIKIAQSFKWKIKKAERGSYLIHFSKFLQNTSLGRLFQNAKWKLINRSMTNGWIQINPAEMIRLLQEEIRNQIEKSVQPITVKPPEEIQKDINEIKKEFNKIKYQFEKIHIDVKAKKSEYPPCISSLIERATNGQHLSHVERFTLVTYLLHQNVEIDSIVDLFSKVSDFKEELTRYQIENLAGQKSGVNKPYITYNCSTLQTHNVCPLLNDPICNSIKNPLSYHLVKKNSKPRKKRRK